jgi:hypothetical protein
MPSNTYKPTVEPKRDVEPIADAAKAEKAKRLARLLAKSKYERDDT